MKTQGFLESKFAVTAPQRGSEVTDYTNTHVRARTQSHIHGLEASCHVTGKLDFRRDEPKRRLL